MAQIGAQGGATGLCCGGPCRRLDRLEKAPGRAKRTGRSPRALAGSVRPVDLGPARRSRFAPKTLLAGSRRAAVGRRPGTGPALERGLLGWLGESAGNLSEPGYAREALACAHAIVRLTAVLSPEAWWALLDHLLAAVADAGAIEPEDDPLAHQLLAGELALTLAYLLPELTPCRKLKPAARRCFPAARSICSTAKACRTPSTWP